ncbi:hypothetical protein H8959_004414 [Pygathrix nigripes]
MAVTGTTCLVFTQREAAFGQAQTLHTSGYGSTPLSLTSLLNKTKNPSVPAMSSNGTNKEPGPGGHRAHEEAP